MYSSKINDLRESIFHTSRKRDQKSLLQQKLSSPRSKASLEEVIDPKELLQYQLKPVPCPFHHQPIKFLCVRSDCRSSTFAVCGLEECRQLHQQPDVNLVELNIFNEVVRDSCSSLHILGSKLRKYFKEIKESIIHRLDLSIEKALHMVENVYVQEVPRLIRQKKHSELNSNKLGNFIRRELAEGSIIRSRMETLRNKVSERISDRQAALQHLYASKEYQCLLLEDVINPQAQKTFHEITARIQVKDLSSSILTEQEEVQTVMKLLRQNRASSFTKMTSLFRASDHQFSSLAFHQAVDGISPILLLIKTQMGKKIGAYLNCKLNEREQWIADVSGVSFIFSVDREESYRLKAEGKSRLKAAFGGPGGMQLGSGCDLYLGEDCHSSHNSGSNLGGSYKLPGHLEFNTAQSKTYLAGEQYFQVEEYEIFIFQ